jgi:signal transduction histidine kinase
VNSLERRLHLGLAISLIALMGLMGWLLITLAQQLTVTFISSRLEHDAESLLSTLQFDGSGQPLLNETKLPGIYSQPLSGHYYLIITQDTPPLRSRSLWDASITAASLPPGETHHWRTNGPSDQTLLVWAGGYFKQGQLLTLVVAEDLSPLRQRLLYYSGLFTGLTLIFLLVLLLIQRRIVRRSFQPLHQLSDEIRRLEKGEIEQLTSEVPQEVQPLVIEVNRLLRMMAQRLHRSRTAMGNLAHALKGPLNLLTQLSDSEPLETHPAVRQELQQYTAQLRRLIDHELKRARLAGSGGPGQRFIPAQEMPALVELLKRIYKQKTLQFDCHYPEGYLANSDRDDMLELLGNLLDNACKWASSQVGCTIVVDKEIILTVEDDGPGCSEQQIESLTQRGSRIDESKPGDGLGLAIVSDIAQLYHARLLFDRSPGLGGLRVQVIFNEKIFS